MCSAYNFYENILKIMLILFSNFFWYKKTEFLTYCTSNFENDKNKKKFLKFFYKYFHI